MMYKDVAVSENAGLANVLLETDIFSPVSSCQSGRKVACTVLFMTAQCLFTDASVLAHSGFPVKPEYMTPFGIS